LVSDAESQLVLAAGTAVGIGADPSPVTMTALAELVEMAKVAPLMALRAPASIKAAMAAVIVLFMGYNLLRS
jgi:hypothetical protein